MKEEEARRIIISHLITEKGTLLQEKNNQYLFRVDSRSNKIQIEQALEKLFKVKILSIRTIRVKGKQRRIGRSAGYRPGWKKAIVTLQEGDKIDLT
jgi:large subunit ribosomal protein L23